MSGRIVTKSEWLSVPFDISVFEKNGTADLLGFEELLDYEIIREGDTPKKGTKRKNDKVKDKKKKKKSKKSKTKETSSDEVATVDEKIHENPAVEESAEKPKEKKKKKKARKEKPEPEVEIANESVDAAAAYVEDSEPELEFESDEEADEEPEEEPEDYEMDEKTMSRMAEWNKLFVPLPVMRALAEMKFHKPTPIQSMVLPAAVRGRRDVVGAAETGSGKTLAFGIPILSGILDDKKFEKDLEDAALLDAEYDREKAEASAAEKEEKSESSSEQDDDDQREEPIEEQPNGKETKKQPKRLRALILTPTRELAVQVRNHLVAVAKYTGIKVAVVIGGMALPKQERVLRKGPEILVATPGRLWELINDGNLHLSSLEDIRYLAIDETDRMLEKGHFRELTAILDLVNADPNKTARRQNFVFSATLTIVHDLPERIKEKKKKKPLTSDQKLNAIMEHIGVKSKAKVVDITNKSMTAETLTETQIPCSNEEKDFYLYYILRQHPGRTLVFCNSIDCVRRLNSVLAVLNCKPLPLHAQMHQKQRLKNLERFSADEKGLLIATDVAARGLDIPNVQHVVHYQVPRTSESYVHRSGRTARASKEGVSVVLVEPSEYPAYQKMCKTLGRKKDLPDFPVDIALYAAIKQIVKTGRDFEKLEHMYKKQQSESSWFKKMALEADLVLDEDDRVNAVEDKARDADDVSKDLKAKKWELEALLKQKLIPRGTSIVYPASTALNVKRITDTEKGKNAVRVVNDKSKAIQKKTKKNKPKKKNKAVVKSPSD